MVFVLKKRTNYGPVHIGSTLGQTIMKTYKGFPFPVQPSPAAETFKEVRVQNIPTNSFL